MPKDAHSNSIMLNITVAVQDKRTISYDDLYTILWHDKTLQFHSLFNNLLGVLPIKLISSGASESPDK